jgi:SAM-dependent methyltransferase
MAGRALRDGSHASHGAAISVASPPSRFRSSREVLDACCGSRMFWFDKTDHRALFLDKRREVCTDPRGREVVIDPDVLGDFANLPFDDATFSLVVFDPPHTFNGANSAMAQKYGRLEPGWREQITAGFAECFRVLRDGGTLVFKWNEHRVPVKTVLAMTPEKPLFGHRSGSAAKTHWLVFMKSRDSDGTRSAETACPAPVPQDCQARAEGIAQEGDA